MGGCRLHIIKAREKEVILFTGIQSTDVGMLLTGLQITETRCMKECHEENGVIEQSTSVKQTF